MKIKKIETVYNGYFKAIEVTIETSKGKNIKREIFSRGSHVNSSDSVAAMVYDSKKDKYIFTKQFRVGLYNDNTQYIIEATAGTLENNEKPEECMIREIEEEWIQNIKNI